MNAGTFHYAHTEPSVPQQQDAEGYQRDSDKDNI